MRKEKMISVLFTILKYASLVIASVVSLVPVCVCILTAFKTNEEYASTSVLELPASFLNFENFVVAFQQANMLRCFMNTALVLVVVLTASVFIGSMLAYVLNRFEFAGRGLVQNLFMFAALLPGIAMQVTVYQIMYSLRLINHLYGYMIVLMGTDIISIYIFLQFFENLPVWCGGVMWRWGCGKWIRRGGRRGYAFAEGHISHANGTTFR
jgi:ABC-type glycerol-3-phosphate transport system permease component